MKENGEIDATVYLFSFTMDDSRADRAGTITRYGIFITWLNALAGNELSASCFRLMDKKGGNDAAKQNMIDVFYKKDASMNQRGKPNFHFKW